jgi:chemotaxis protein MotB
MLLQVYQEKAAASDQTRDQAALELQDIKKQLEELARREPESFQWNPFSGTLGVTAEVLFRPGKADLLPSGLDALKKVLPIFKDGKELIRVDGHTDADPIKYSKWQDNWELAGARARTVLMFLEKGGISHDRLFFAAYADTRPRADNKSPEGKRANRRVELVPLPAPAASTTPEEPKPR